MKRFINDHLFSLLIFISLTVLIYWRFFFQHLFLFPGNYLIAWYEPWKTINTIGNTIIIAHKPIADDIFRQLYPYKILTISLIQHLQLPLWNTYNGAGMPLLATMSSGFLNPFNILFLMFDGPTAWSLFAIIEPLLMGIFTYFYCQKIRISKISSIFSSIILMLSGAIIVRSLYVGFLFVFSCLPLLLILVEEYKENIKTKKILFVPLVVAFMFFSGHPQIIFYVLFTTLFYAIYRLKSQSLIFLLFTLIGVGLAGIQIIPTLELFTNGNISHKTSEFIIQSFLLPITNLITIFIPNYFGNPAIYNYFGFGDYIETIAYVGTIPCFFAFLSFMGKKKEFVRFFATVIITTTLTTINWFGSKLLFSLSMPLLSTSAPSRIFILITFSIAILSGIGFDYWLSQKELHKKINRIIILFLIILFSIGIFTFIVYLLKPVCSIMSLKNCYTISLRNIVLEFIVFSSALIILLIYLVKQKNIYVKKIFPLLIIVIISIIGLYNAYKFLPFSPINTFYPSTPLISYLKLHIDARIFGISQASIKTDIATYLNIYDPQYYDPLYNRRYGEFINFANTGRLNSEIPRSDIEIINDATVSASLGKRRERLFTLLSIEYLIFKKSEVPENNNHKILWKDNAWYVVENPSLPRAYAVNNYKVIKDSDQILIELFNLNYNPYQNVITEEKPALKLENKELQQNIHIEKDSGNKLSLKAQINQASILVLTDNYYPGWKAFVDGKETKIYRANYTFRAIELTKGSHEVEFIFQPTSLKIGTDISLMSIILLIIVALRMKIRNLKLINESVF